MTTVQIDIRALRSIAEFEEAEALQRAVWEMPNDRDVVPLHLLVTAQKNGGLVLGAFAGDEMIGLLFGFLGRQPGGDVKHCSHMMGVLRDFRGQGVGERLKLRQRELVLEQGLELVTWTYDPLERANATLNIGKLGATCGVYLRNVYGELRDDLNKGLPTDRFQVDWRLGSPRVVARLTPGSRSRRSFGELVAAGAEVATGARETASWLPQPAGWTMVAGPLALVEIPWDMQQVKACDLALAAAWRLQTRAIFEAYFEAGFVVGDVVTVEDAGRRACFYLLEAGAV